MNEFVEKHGEPKTLNKSMVASFIDYRMKVRKDTFERACLNYELRSGQKPVFKSESELRKYQANCTEFVKSQFGKHPRPKYR